MPAPDFKLHDTGTLRAMRKRFPCLPAAPLGATHVDIWARPTDRPGMVELVALWSKPPRAAREIAYYSTHDGAFRPRYLPAMVRGAIPFAVTADQEGGAA